MEVDTKKILLDEKHFDMFDEESRLKSFVSWPFGESAKCTVSKMAEAGFYHRPTENEPDAVQCFVCLKELDGWEPDDDPWVEHRRHSQNCSFATFGKRQNELSIKELCRVEKDRHINFATLKTQQRIEEFEKMADDTRKKLKRIK